MSRSEAGQQKALLVLDSDWRETDRILLDVGPRFHMLSSVEPEFPANLREGDRYRSVNLARRLGLLSLHIEHAVVR